MREVVKQGAYWQIGDGTKVQIRGDKWLPNMSTKHIISFQKNLPMNAKVCALIDEDGLRWIKERVTQEFFPHEAQKILGISLSSNRVPDLLIWASTKSRRYSTKSAYKMLTSKQDFSTPSPFDTSAQTNCWRRIWPLSIPNKIKHFLWRACHESLPTKENLLVRNVTRNALCEWCNEEVKDTVHAWWGSPILKEVWWEEEISETSSPSASWTLEICGLVLQI